MDDRRLDELLGRLRDEPVPEGRLKASWHAIDAGMEWRAPSMHPLAFTRTLIQPKWAAAAAAAALLCLTFAVGKARLGGQAPTDMSEEEESVGLVNGPATAGAEHELVGSADGTVTTLATGEAAVSGAVSREARRARPQEDAISDVALGGGRPAGGAGGNWAYDGKEGYRDGNRKAADRAAPAAPPPPLAAAPAAAKDAPGNWKGKAEGGKAASSTGRGQSGQYGGQGPLASPDLLPVPGNADKNPGAPARGDAGPGGSQPPGQSSQKIIKTAELSLEVRKSEEASREVDKLVTRYRGFYADNRVTQNDDGTATITVVVRVPQANFEALYAELKKLGRVKTENAKGEDVTEKYTDLAARIRNAEHLEKSLLVLLDEKKKNGKMSEILEVQRELAKTREEIEKMQGSMRVMENLIEFGTIYLTLAERSRTVPSGSLNIEVKDATASDRELDRVVGEVAGQVVSRTSVKRPDGTLMITAAVKAPMIRFGELVEKLKALGVRTDREDIRGYNLAAVTEDAGAKDVLATVNLILFEPSLQKPGGNARIQVETLDSAAQVIGAILKEVDGTQVSRHESRVNDQATATYQLRVSRAKFPSLVLSLPRIGTVETKQVVGADVVGVEGPAAKVQCDLELQIHERDRETPGGSATLSTTRMAEAATKLAELLKSVDGQVTSHTESKQADGTVNAQYQVQVKRGKFAQLDAGLGTIGRLQHKEVHGTDLAEVKGAAADTFCSLSLEIQERRAPMPTADLKVIVSNAKDAGDKLAAICKAAKAETGVPEIIKGDNLSEVQIWQPQLPVEAFDTFVAQVQQLGKARGTIKPVRVGEEEKPDPKAMTGVVVRLVQQSPFERQEPQQDWGSLTGALRAAGDGFVNILRYLIAGLPYVLVLVIVVFGAYKLISRAGSRKNAGEKTPGPETPRKE